ncbi:protein phosphatase 1 regulatory subunit 1A-like [Petromyzon marinus]|uniref:protein phosphatase 1 regulatory subunit 1A-like n=1 Tax=Petromyzon marinus TaxID=7757 RepID=UPI003F720DF1
MDSSEQQRRVQLGRVQTADSMEQRSPKKLQFVMPPGQMQLDPAALEQIRRRRPTPAKLVVMNEQASQPDDRTQDPSEGCAVADSDSSDVPKATTTTSDCVYNPPTMEELRHALELCCTDQQLSSSGTDGAAKEGPNGVAAGAEVTWDAGGEVARVAGLNSDSETPALAQSPGDVDNEEPETLPSVEEAPRKPRRKDTPVYQVPPLALAGAGRVQRRPRDVQHQQQQQPVPAMLEEEWVEELLVPEETLVSAKVNVQPSVPS